MAEHFSPILVLLLPFYALHESPATLLVVQSVVVAGGAYLLFRLAEDAFGDGWLALAICASYLLAPDTFQSQWHDFHMDLLVPPMIFGAVWALRRGRTAWFLLCVALLWATKEDAFIYTSFLAAYAWAAHGRRRLCIAVLVASVVLGAVVLALVLPAYRTLQESGPFFTKYAGEGYKFAFRYNHLGKGFGNVILNIVSDPVYVLGYVTGDVRMTSVLTLLAPLGFAALLGGLRPALLFVPTFVMLLGSDDNMERLAFYYGAIPLAFAYASGTLGLAALGRRLEERFAGVPRFPARWRLAATAYVAASALWLVWANPESPLSPVRDRPAYLRTDRTALLDEVVDSIPPEVPVSATGYVGIHLTDRPRPRMLPWGLPEAQYVVVDLYRPPWPQEMPGLAQMVEGLARSGEWGVVRAEQGVVVFRRGAQRDLNERAIDMMYLPVLEPEEWETSDFPNLAVRGGSASAGAALVVTPRDLRGPGFLFFGPYLPLPEGRYRVHFRLAAAPEFGRPDDAVVATIDVFRAEQTVASRDLAFPDFGGGYLWKTFTLDFERDDWGPWEFRVFYHDVGTLAADRIWLERLDQ